MQLQEKYGSSMTAEYLADMRYADVTIKECLRLAAIISTVPKRALTTFELGGFTIPKVCNHLPSACCLCRNRCAAESGSASRMHMYELTYMLQFVLADWTLPFSQSLSF